MTAPELLIYGISSLASFFAGSYVGARNVRIKAKAITRKVLKGHPALLEVWERETKKDDL